MISKFIISDEDYNDLYILERGYKAEQIESFIRKHKKENFGVWNMETLEKDIKLNFVVKQIIHCDTKYDLEEV